MNELTVIAPVKSEKEAERIVAGARPFVRGKFIFANGEKLYIRGVTYGTFKPDEAGDAFPSREVVQCDFDAMAAAGINAVRTYTTPPLWLLDLAQACGLYVMVGLPWEQHITFLEDRERAAAIERRVRDAVQSCARHPAILAFAVGNEIPSPIVRWHGRRKVERFIKRLYRAVKDEDQEALVTYVSYPPTEYLQLPFLDFLSFNVYLESQKDLATYFGRLQNIAGDRPLLIAELGLDSIRNGEDLQAMTLDWQIATTFAAGCAGMFVFAWTDEWYRGGHDIDDWDFGLTDRGRQPKAALAAVREAFARVPFADVEIALGVSVVICAHNEEDCIGETLEALRDQQYPNFEVIVVDDGSTDSTAEIARRFPIRVISTKNQGLSAARNVGMRAATKDIVAYLDGDAYPDPHWLRYLTHTFQTTDHAGVGGPNIHPPEDGMVAECVANAPGGPVHVLLSDSVAEHIPGCNMAFRRERLLAVNGFDPVFRAAGDDVDLCWRLQELGWTLGFSPAAVVWHHRRNSVRDYWKQQKGYGKAEALLERKWPEKYNRLGHVEWKGRLYGAGHMLSPLAARWRVYHGIWGSGLFQSIYSPHQPAAMYFPLMPEWHFLIFVLVLLSALGLVWPPLLGSVPLLAGANLIVLAQAAYSTAHARFARPGREFAAIARMRLLTLWLYLIQPLARLLGRLKYGLTPWKARRNDGIMLPRPQRLTFWSEQWKSPDTILTALESLLHARRIAVFRGGGYDRWDLEVAAGTTGGSVRLIMTTEEHGGGKQMFRFRLWPVCPARQTAIGLMGAALAAFAWVQQAEPVAAVLALVAAAITGVAVLNSARSLSAAVRVLKQLGWKS